MPSKVQPINAVQWVDVNQLEANDWNPNHVMGPEMKLLALSLLQQGWIQPILVWPKPDGKGFVIIDGFHRTTVARNNKAVYAMTGGKVPVVIMEMSVAERMLLTIRINRAKGNHAAFKMHEIVSAVVNDHGLSIAHVCESIGADKDEVNTLLAKDVFAKKEVDKFNYSKAWVPPVAKQWGLGTAAQPEVTA